MTKAEMIPVLRAGAARIRTLGWLRGQLSNEGGSACAVGALGFALGFPRVPAPMWWGEGCIATCLDILQEVTRVLALPPAAVIGRRGAEIWDAVVEWNNADGQTAENVATGLEYTALVLEQEVAQEARLTAGAPAGDAIGVLVGR